MAISDHLSKSIKPIAGSLGAEIADIDLASMNDSELYQVQQAFLRYHVLVFREQELGPADLKRFASNFGSLEIHPYIKGLTDHPEVVAIIKEPDEKVNFGGCWHSDMSFLQEPPLGSVLYALEVPEVGGDTLFSNQHAAYAALSPRCNRFLMG